MVKYLFSFLLALLLAGCSDGESAAIPTSASTPLPSYIVSDEGWKVFVTHVRSSPAAQRGWKEITVDVIFESTSSLPYLLFQNNKYLTIVDDTGTARQKVDLVSGWSNINTHIAVPSGVSFRLHSLPVRIPEISNPSQYIIEICGETECSSDYAIFRVVLNQAKEGISTSFPLSVIPPGVPLLSKKNSVNLEIPNKALITFHPDPTLIYDDKYGYSMQMTIDVKNISPNNIDSSVFDDWISTSITDSGDVFVWDTFTCAQENKGGWSIPPGYTDRLVCDFNITYDENLVFNKLWMGLSRDAGSGDPSTFLQIMYP